MSNENNAHIEANLEAVRVYLIGQFKGFELTDTSALAHVHCDEIIRRTIPSKSFMATAIR
jgi:hypothetical protein